MEQGWKYVAILASLLVGVVLADITLDSQTSPLFLWSNTKYFSGKNIQVPDIISTQDIQDAFLQRKGDSPIINLFQPSFNTLEAIVIFIEPQLRTEQVSILADAYSTKSNGGVLSHLKKLIENSASSVVAPYVNVGNLQSIGSSLVLNLMKNLQSGASVVLARAQGSEMLSELADNVEVSHISLKDLMLKASTNWEVMSNGITDLIVVCFDAEEEVLNEKVRESYSAHDSFLQILDAFNKAGAKYVALYTADKPSSNLLLDMPVSDPAMSAFEEMHQQSRSNTINDFFPMDIMQALIFSIPLLIIAFLGICCTFNLQSALKFDAEKKLR